MAYISLNHIKLIIKSAIASATRYKPNLEVTDPDDPRYVAGKLPKEKITSVPASALPTISSTKIDGLSIIATTGSYNDLSDAPVLASVASSGNYNDLSNIPSKLDKRTNAYQPGVIEGLNTTASGAYSHAEGWGSTASNSASHAEGLDTTASGQCSHAEGSNTIASAAYQHVQGFYNLEKDYSYIHIVGNGTKSNRSNAHTLDWFGNAWYAGTVEGTAMIVKSSTDGSTKRFKITVDDTGTISATEVTT